MAQFWYVRSRSAHAWHKIEKTSISYYAELSIKKNWLFIVHPDAGQRSAILYSLTVSCERHGKDRLAYLKDILTRLPRMTNQDDLGILTPENWQAAL
jgi:hypothetical protein